jgi:hypothetical protein
LCTSGTIESQPLQQLLYLQDQGEMALSPTCLDEHD